VMRTVNMMSGCEVGLVCCAREAAGAVGALRMMGGHWSERLRSPFMFARRRHSGVWQSSAHRHEVDARRFLWVRS
jgi:hypothetical protein